MQKKNIKEFINKMIEMLKETAKKIEVKIGTKMDEVKFNIIIARLKKAVKSQDLKYTSASGTVDMLDLRKIQMEFEKGVSVIMKEIRLLRKCKTPQELDRMSQLIIKMIDDLEETIPVSNLDKYLIHMSKRTFVEKLKVNDIKTTPQAVIAKMSDELSALESEWISGLQIGKVSVATHNIPGVKNIVESQITQKMQYFTSRLCHYASRYMLSIAAWFGGTAIKNIATMNAELGNKGLMMDDVPHKKMSQTISANILTNAAGNASAALQVGAGINAINTTRELVNEVRGKSIPKKK